MINSVPMKKRIMAGHVSNISFVADLTYGGVFSELDTSKYTTRSFSEMFWRDRSTLLGDNEMIITNLAELYPSWDILVYDEMFKAQIIKRFGEFEMFLGQGLMPAHDFLLWLEINKL